jgi:hypothetical protein
MFLYQVPAFMDFHQRIHKIPPFNPTLSHFNLFHVFTHCQCAATQELPSVLWNTMVHCRVHKSPLVHIVSQINPIHTIPSYLRSSLILSPHLHLGLPSGLFPFGFPTNILYPFLFPPIPVTYLAHQALRIIFELLGDKAEWDGRSI